MIPARVGSAAVTRLSRPLGVAMIALAAVSTAGCTFTTQQTTELYYEPADGVEALLGPDVVVSSVLIVTDEQGAPGNLIARVVNSGIEPARVLLASEEAGVEVTVTAEPGETVEIGPEGEQVIVESVDAVPGTLVPFVAALPDGELAFEILVPVFDETFPRYAELVPEVDTGTEPIIP